MQSKNQTRKPNEKHHSWLSNDREVNDLVRQCMVLRLSQKDSIQKLSEMGHKMSERTFRRIKTEITESNKHIANTIFEDEFFPHLYHIFDSLKFMEKTLWEIVSESPDYWVKLKAIWIIKKALADKYSLINSTPILAKIDECAQAYNEKMANSNSSEKNSSTMNN